METADAEPDDEPPGIRPGAAPLTGVPKWQLRPLIESSGLVGLGLAGKAGAGIQQALHGRGRLVAYARNREHHGVAGRRRIPGDIEQILDPETQPGQWPLMGVHHIDRRVGHEGQRGVDPEQVAGRRC